MDIITTDDTRAWDHLIRYGEHEWPEEWEQARADAERWRPVALRICERHELKVTGEMTLETASHVALVADEIIVKIMGRRSPVWFTREVESLRLLGGIPETMVPRLLAHGDAADGNPDHPYIVMERRFGSAIRAFRNGLTETEIRSITAQLANIVRAVHNAPLDALTSFDTSPSVWVRRMRERARFCSDYIREAMSPDLLSQVDEYLNANLRYATEDFRPVLLHADINSTNLRLQRRNGTLEITGLIDLGDIDVGPVEYELISIYTKAFLGNKDLMRSFLDAFGIPVPLPGDMKRRLKLYTMLHRFTVVWYYHQQLPSITRLDDLLEELWTF